MKYLLLSNHPLYTSHLTTQLRRLDIRAEFIVYGSPVNAEDEEEIQYFSTTQEVKKKLKSWNPDVLIVTDATPAFLKLVSLAGRINIRTCACLYSSVSKPAGLKRMDKILTTSPTENERLKSNGLSAECVGSPLLDVVKDHVLDHQFTLSESNINIAVLPGRKPGSLAKAINKVGEGSNYHFHIAAEGGDQSYASFKTSGNVTVHSGKTFELLKQCNAALTMSGDSSMKALFLNCPQVSIYQKKLFGGSPQWHSLINATTNRAIVKEFPVSKHADIRKEIELIINDQNYCAGMMADYQELKDKLGHERASKRAAQSIFEWLESGSS